MRTFEGFRSIDITIESGNIVLSQSNGRYSTESITFPVSQWGHLAAAISGEVAYPTPEPAPEVEVAA